MNSKLLKLSAVMIALMSCYDINAEAVKNNGALLSASAQTSAIQPGMGYSSDSLSPAPNVCFNPTSVSEVAQRPTQFSSQSESLGNIARAFGLSDDFSSGYRNFSNNEIIRYLNSMQESDLSLSANYYQAAIWDENVSYARNAGGILNESGQSHYRDATDPTFRLSCGDRLITSYNEGAGLILSMRINFYTEADKQSFISRFGSQFGSFLNAGAEASSVAASYGIQGTITITGLQLGGEPSQLSSILPNLRVQCDLGNIAACQDTISSLYRYATQVFPTQFQRNTAVRLGGHVQDEFVKNFGLILALPYATPEVLAAQQALVEARQSNQYYLEHLNNIIQHYPTNGLDAGYRNRVIALRDITQSNINVIDNGVGEGRASDCYASPQNCVAIAASILSRVQKISSATVSDLLEPIRYNILFAGVDINDWTSCTSAGAYFWPRGVRGNGDYFWYAPPSFWYGDLHITSGIFTYGVSAPDGDDRGVPTLKINGTFHFKNDNYSGGTYSFESTSDGIGNYVGKFTYDGKYGNRHIGNKDEGLALHCSTTTRINPYYFEPYHSA